VLTTLSPSLFVHGGALFLYNSLFSRLLAYFCGKTFKREQMDNKDIHNLFGGIFLPVVGNFVLESLQLMIPWLIAMFCVVMCDLVTGVRKSMLMKQEVRFSRAWRDTMSKLVTYFSFVIMVVIVNRAAGHDYEIDTYACLFVCFIEMCSITSNILKPKGYTFDMLKALSIFLSKVFKVEKDEVSEVITKTEEKKKDGKRRKVRADSHTE
jgi:hypothetical protein